MNVETLRYMRAMARELASLADKQKMPLLAYIFRMAEMAANELIGPKEGRAA